MTVAHLAWPSLDSLSEDVFWFRTGGLPGNKNSVLSLDLILWRLTQIWRLWTQWETPSDWRGVQPCSPWSYRCASLFVNWGWIFCQRKYTFFIITLWSMFISFACEIYFLSCFNIRGFRYYTDEYDGEGLPDRKLKKWLWCWWWWQYWSTVWRASISGDGGGVHLKKVALQRLHCKQGISHGGQPPQHQHHQCNMDHSALHLIIRWRWWVCWQRCQAWLKISGSEVATFHVGGNGLFLLNSNYH